MPQLVCCVCSARKHGPKSLTLYGFPKDEKRCQLWLKMLGMEPSQMSCPERKNKRICEGHFEEHYLGAPSAKRNLLSSAVPTININMKGMRGGQERMELDRREEVERPVDLMVEDERPGAVRTENERHGDLRAEVEEPGGLVRVEEPGDFVRAEVEEPGDFVRVEVEEPGDFVRAEVERPGDFVRAEVEEPGDFVRAEVERPGVRRRLLPPTPKTRKIRSYRAKISHLCRILSARPKVTISAINSQLKTLLSPAAYTFISSQLKAACTFPKGRRWTVNDKTFALSIYLQSPAAYRVMRKILSLPSKSTLLKSISELGKCPGFCNALLVALGKAASKLSTRDRLCVLSWDEMAIKAALAYDPKSDSVIGFQNFGDPSNCSSEPAQQALVFCVRGLTQKWKQPIGYFFSHTSTPSSILKELVMQAIAKLDSIGLNVIAIVCDQGPCNQRLFREFGVSESRPHLQYGQRKVFTFFDAPHLLKSVRNNLQKYDCKFGKQKEKTASWTHVSGLYTFDSAQKYKIAPRLTEAHINCKSMTTMKVKLAAQVFSHSVAAGLSTLTTFGHLPAGAAWTAEYVGEMDELFDSVNSSCLHAPKALACAVTSSSRHVDVWRGKLEFVKQWHFVKPNGHSFTPPCQRGWLLTLSASIQLWEEVQRYEMSFLLMRRLNQDCLENTFADIRRKGGNQSNPTSVQFQPAMRAVMTHNLLSRSCSTNCEPDGDTLLSGLCQSSPAEAKSLNLVENPGTSNQINSATAIAQNWDQNNGEGSNTIENEDLNDFADIADDFTGGLNSESSVGLDPAVENVMAYVAGYLIYKLHKVHTCDICFEILQGPKEMDQRNLLIYFKEYGNCPTGLRYPSDKLMGFFTEMSSRWHEHIDRGFHQPGVVRRMIAILHGVDGRWLDQHGEHAVFVKGFLIKMYVKVMIHFKIRMINRTITTKETSKRLSHLQHK